MLNHSFVIHLLIISLFCIPFCHAISLIDRIPFHQIGPEIASWDGLNAIFPESRYATNYTPVDPSAPILKIGIALALSGPSNINLIADAQVVTTLTFVVDYINAFGGAAIYNDYYEPIYHQLCIVYADHQSSESLMRIIYSQMIDEGIELFMGPFGDELQQSFNQLLQSIDQSIDVSVVTAVSFNKQAV